MKNLIIILILNPCFMWAQKSTTLITDGNTSLATPNPTSILLIDPIKPTSDLYIITKTCKMDFSKYGKLVISTPAGKESVTLKPTSNILFTELFQLLEDNKNEITELKKKLKAYESRKMTNE